MKIEKEFYSERDIEKLGIRSAAALRNDRWQGNNILPFIKVGKNIRYRKKDVLDFMEKHTTAAIE
jgi:hypothetical protein